MIKAGFQCGRINIHPMTNKRSACFNLAKWISPERIHTTGRLKICDKCREEMAAEYRKSGRLVEFEKISLNKKVVA